MERQIGKRKKEDAVRGTRVGRPALQDNRTQLRQESGLNVGRIQTGGLGKKEKGEFMIDHLAEGETWQRQQHIVVLPQKIVVLQEVETALRGGNEPSRSSNDVIRAGQIGKGVGNREGKKSGKACEL